MNNQRKAQFPTFRLLAMGLIAYLLIDLIVSYIKGGPEAPSLTLLLLSAALFGGGLVFIGIMTWREWKKAQETADDDEQEKLP